MRLRSISVDGTNITKTPFGRQMARTMLRQMGGPSDTSVTRVKFLALNKVELRSGRMTATCTRR